MIDIAVEKTLMGAEGPFLLRFKTHIAKKELITLYGPTGCGKTSVLRMLAGLLTPDGGSIRVDDQQWFDKEKKISLPPQQRAIGMVFQDYSLFPNMTVRENLEFALSQPEDSSMVDELLEIAQLTQLQNQRPAVLSGGQKQRVALTRALVRKPELLLLDEPLSALDSQMRFMLQQYIVKFHERFQLTTVLVSHDLAEVSKMSARVLVIEGGEIIKDCAPDQLL